MVDNRLIHKSIGRLCTSIAILAVLAVSNFGCAETVLVTGANSGLGLEFSKQYAAKGWNVIATHRRDEVPDTLADLMSDYENVRVEKMDVSSPEQVFGLARKLGDQPIDVLINNAGIFCLCDWMDDDDTSQTFGSLEFDQFDMIMRVNARGMALVSEAFLGNIKSGEQKKIITMTSTLGSLTNPTAGLSAMWYGASKAAVNKLNVAIAETLRSDGIIVVPMHPGSVRVEKQAGVDTSVNPGILETEDSVRQMIATIAALELGDSGKIRRYDGAALAW